MASHIHFNRQSVMKKSIILLTLLCSFLCAFSQGLQFHGNERNIDGRSSLAIPSELSKAKTAGVYDLGFTIRNHNISSPGNIFCIQNRCDSNTFALMFNYNEPTDQATFIFAKSGERNLYSTSFKGSELREKAMPMVLKINQAAGTIYIAIGSHRTSIPVPELRETGFAPQLHFSMSRHMVESASFSIRDLRIISDGKETVIPLTESKGEAVHDSQGKEVGKVTRPNWLINRSYFWDRVWTTFSDTPTGFTFDPYRQMLYSYSSDSIKAFDIRTRSQTFRTVKGDSLPVRHGMNLLDGKTGRIIPYEVYNDALLAELDPASGEWRRLGETSPDAVWHHHASAYRSKDHTLLLFGGYGNRRYSDRLVRYDLNRHIWDTIPLGGDRIDPRFYPAMMLTPSQDTLYLYGGKGNPQGLQDLGTRYYYDFYRIDLKRRTVKRLWSQNAPAEDRVPARTLIPDPDGKHFYAITYPEYRPHSSLQLYRIDMADGTSTAVCDTIPLISEEIATNVALYSNQALERLYCVVQQFAKYGQTVTSVYSITAPPVSAAQLQGPVADKRNLTPIAVIASGLAALILLAVIVVRRRKKTCESTSRSETDVNNAPLAPTADVTEETRIDPMGVPTAFTEDSIKDLPSSPASNCISLFGPFSAIDANGRSITHLFSPKLKLIFLYILLQTESHNGVTSSDLNVTFWADKDPDKVKNLRNVTLNKLRKALADINGISLVYEQGLFRIDMQDPCGCDIERLYKLSSRLSDAVPAPEKADEIDSIVIKGKFLADTSEPIFDYFRQKMDTYMVKYLAAAIARSHKEGKYDMVRRLCYAMLETDPLSETALTYLVKVAHATGRHDRARAVYQTFCRDYLKMMGEEYPRSFDELG